MSRASKAHLNGEQQSWSSCVVVRTDEDLLLDPVSRNTILHFKPGLHIKLKLVKTKKTFTVMELKEL